MVDDLPQWVWKDGIQTILDPSAASFKAALREVMVDQSVSGSLYQQRRFRLYDADNSVLDGIRDTARCLQRGVVKINSAACPRTVKEFGGYIWDSTGDDRPVKENDHAMDAIRYFVRTKRLVKPEPAAYTSPFRRYSV